MIFNTYNAGITKESLFKYDEDGKRVEDEITLEDKMLLLARAMTDRRLSARDLKIYMFLMNISAEDYTQEEIADFLNLTRVNINKSISKLCLLNYIDKDRDDTYSKMRYTILSENIGVVSSLKVLDIDKAKTVDKLTKDDLNALFEERALLKEKLLDNIIEFDLDMPENKIDALLKDEASELLLFLASTENEKASYFKDKYLENTIKFSLKYDVINDKTLFMKFYCMLTKSKNYTLDDLMMVNGIAHRDTSIARGYFTNLVDVMLDEYRWTVETLLSFNNVEKERFERNENSRYIDIEFSDMFDSLLEVNISQKVFSEEEFLFLVFILECFSKFKIISYGIDLEEYIKIKAGWLNEELDKVQRLKFVYSGELEIARAIKAGEK